MTRTSILAALALAGAALAGPALAADAAEDLDKLLAQRCAGSMDQLRQTTSVQIQCSMGKLRETDAGQRGDAEIALMAIAACADAQTPIREVLGQCAGDRADDALQSYLSFAFVHLVEALVRGKQAAIAEKTHAPAEVAQGPVFDALVAHIGCVAVAGFQAAGELTDRAAVLARAAQTCAASGKALDDVIQAKLSPAAAATERKYVETAVAAETGQAFDSHKAAQAADGKTP